MPVHIDNGCISWSTWQPSCFASARYVSMAPSCSRSKQPGQIHVQATYNRHLPLDTKRCQHVFGLSTTRPAATTATDHRRSECYIANPAASRAQERHNEPSHCEPGKSRDIAPESHSQHQFHAGLSRSSASCFPWSSCSYIYHKSCGSNSKLRTYGRL